jgi:hypothetical protein
MAGIDREGHIWETLPGYEDLSIQTRN